MKLRGAVALALVAISFGLLGFWAADAWRTQREPVSDNTADTTLSPETIRMVDRLAQIASSPDALSNPFANERRLQHRSSQQPPDGLQRRIRWEFDLANEMLRAGRSNQAIATLTSLERVISNGPSEPALRDKVVRLLGLAYLRLGEQENCIDNHEATVCLVPLQPEARHALDFGSREAMKYFSALLDADSADLGARWLLNLAAMTVGEYPNGLPADRRIDPSRFESDFDIGVFSDMASASGTATMGLAGGSILEDFNGDGHLDIMFSSWGLEDSLTLLINDGAGRYTDRTLDAGLAGLTGGLNLIQADYDNDGDRDVLVLRGAWLGVYGHHPNSLLRNDGEGRFEDVTESAGMLSFMPTQAAAWGDFDNDGWLDLFIGNESSALQSNPSELYRNNQDGTFTEVARVSGLAMELFVKGVAWGDIDNDGWQDLYVSRMGGSNLLFKNLGKPVAEGWAFEDVTSFAGVQGPESGFPTWIWDFDNDGWLDIFAAGYGSDYLGTSAAQVAADYLEIKGDVSWPRLYRNLGNGQFADVTATVGLERALLAMGANFGDLDNDGFDDFYVGTGAPDFAALAPNRMFRNAAGEQFQDVTTSGGFGHIQKGHGIAFGDVDSDGDQDVLAVMGGAFSGDQFPNALFENPGHGHHWLTLRLSGHTSNRDGIGARIAVRVSTDNGPRTIHKVVSSGGSFGASSLQQEIGLGKATGILSIQIKWPGNTRVQRLTGVAMNQVYEVDENMAEARLVTR